eukprot:evm.model.NODE_1031_length_2767_cov_22.913263.1
MQHIAIPNSSGARSATSSPKSQPHQRPPRHRWGGGGGGGSTLRYQQGGSRQGAGEGGDEGEEEDEGEEYDEEEELRGVTPSVPSSPAGSMRRFPLESAGGAERSTFTASLNYTPPRSSPHPGRASSTSGRAAASPSIIFRGATPVALPGTAERPSPAHTAAAAAPAAPAASSAAPAAKTSKKPSSLPTWSACGGPTLQFAILLLPVALYYLASISSSTSFFTSFLLPFLPASFITTASVNTTSISSLNAFRGLLFAMGVLVAVRYLAAAQAQGSNQVVGGVEGLPAQRVTEWGQEGMKNRVNVRFTVEIRKLKRYIDAQQRETSGVGITVLHVAMRALGLALREVPALNGHRVFGEFQPSRTTDVSCELRLRNGPFALLKVGEVDVKSVADISRTLSLKSHALSNGRDVFYNRRQLISRWCPSFLLPSLEACFTFLGAGLGLSLPWLGVRAFPQGGCVVLTSPAVTSSRDFACEADFEVTPAATPSAAFLAPLVLTIGAITAVPKVVGGPRGAQQRQQQEREVILSPVLNVSIQAQLQGGASSLQHVRRLTELVHKYMNDPRSCEEEAVKSVTAAVTVSVGQGARGKEGGGEGGVGRITRGKQRK